MSPCARPASRPGRRRLLGVLIAAWCAWAAGCIPGERPWALVVPEERHLYLHDPAPLPHARFADVATPATVSAPEPKGPPTELTLDEAIRIALENSRVVRFLAGTTAVASGRTVYDPAISATAVDEARAVFDPTVVVRSNFNRIEQPQAVPDPSVPAGAVITGSRIDQVATSVGIQKKTVTGGTLGLDIENTSSRSDPRVQVLDPQDRSSATLSYTQPLLQGAGVAANTAPIVIARINTEISYFQLKDSLQELVRGVIEAYWAVVFARTDAWARRQQVEQSQAAYDRAAARQKQGFANSAEVAQTLVSLSNFRANLIAAEANLLQREDALRNILGLPPGQPERLLPTSAPTTVRVEPRWQETVALAEERRPDLVELKLIIEADRQSLLLARNQAQPQLNATLLYRWNGLEGETPRGVSISSGPGSFIDWTAGVNFSVPLGLRRERAALRRAELLLARDEDNLQQGVHLAVHALSTDVRNLALNYEQFRAYQETRKAARTNLEQQMAEYRIGRAIFLNVLQAISDWGNAVSSEAQALTRYNTDLANLERETGTILESHGVRLFEERYRSIGPLGRCADPRCYPQGVVPGPNGERYPSTGEPPDLALERDRPAQIPAPRPLP